MSTICAETLPMERTESFRINVFGVFEVAVFNDSFGSSPMAPTSLLLVIVGTASAAYCSWCFLRKSAIAGGGRVREVKPPANNIPLQGAPLRREEEKAVVVVKPGNSPRGGASVAPTTPASPSASSTPSSTPSSSPSAGQRRPSGVSTGVGAEDAHSSSSTTSTSQPSQSKTDVIDPSPVSAVTPVTHLKNKVKRYVTQFFQQGEQPVTSIVIVDGTKVSHDKFCSTFRSIRVNGIPFSHDLLFYYCSIECARDILDRGGIPPDTTRNGILLTRKGPHLCTPGDEDLDFMGFGAMSRHVVFAVSVPRWMSCAVGSYSQSHNAMLPYTSEPPETVRMIPVSLLKVLAYQNRTDIMLPGAVIKRAYQLVNEGDPGTDPKISRKSVRFLALGESPAQSPETEKEDNTWDWTRDGSIDVQIVAEEEEDDDDNDDESESIVSDVPDASGLAHRHMVTASRETGNSASGSTSREDRSSVETDVVVGVSSSAAMRRLPSRHGRLGILGSWIARTPKVFKRVPEPILVRDSATYLTVIDDIRRNMEEDEVLLYHFTASNLLESIRQHGLRMSSEGQGDGGLYFSMVGPATYGVGETDLATYERAKIIDCFGMARLHEFEHASRLDALIVCVINPIAVQLVPGGRANAVMIHKSTFETLGRPQNSDGRFYLDPSFIAGAMVMHAPPTTTAQHHLQQPPSGRTPVFADGREHQAQLQREKRLDRDTVWKVVAIQRQRTQQSGIVYKDQQHRNFHGPDALTASPQSRAAAMVGDSSLPWRGIDASDRPNHRGRSGSNAPALRGGMRDPFTSSVPHHLTSHNHGGSSSVTRTGTADDDGAATGGSRHPRLSHSSKSLTRRRRQQRSPSTSSSTTSTVPPPLSLGPSASEQQAQQHPGIPHRGVRRAMSEDLDAGRELVLNQRVVMTHVHTTPLSPTGYEGDGDDNSEFAHEDSAHSLYSTMSILSTTSEVEVEFEPQLMQQQGDDAADDDDDGSECDTPCGVTHGGEDIATSTKSATPHDAPSAMRKLSARDLFKQTPTPATTCAVSCEAKTPEPGSAEPSSAPRRSQSRGSSTASAPAAPRRSTSGYTPVDAEWLNIEETNTAEYLVPTSDPTVPPVSDVHVPLGAIEAMAPRRRSNDAGEHNDAEGDFAEEAEAIAFIMENKRSRNTTMNARREPPTPSGTSGNNSSRKRRGHRRSQSALSGCDIGDGVESSSRARGCVGQGSVDDMHLHTIGAAPGAF